MFNLFYIYIVSLCEIVSEKLPLIANVKIITKLDL